MDNNENNNIFKVKRPGTYVHQYFAVAWSYEEFVISFSLILGVWGFLHLIFQLKKHSKISKIQE